MPSIATLSDSPIDMVVLRAAGAARRWVERCGRGEILVSPRIVFKVPKGRVVNDDVLDGVGLVSAAQIDAAATEIRLHPALPRQNAPSAVYRYLLAHELLHTLIPATAGDPHPPAFMEHELGIPWRQRAQQWLVDHAYPVVRQ